jgi:solute carrier family 25 carnitine/acylcarnitine transporter 20/29
LLETGIGIVTGGLAGTLFWLSVLPLDVAKTRIQTAIDLNINRNPFYQIRLVYRQAGVKALYAGIGPTLVRAFPANAAAIVTWELTARLLNTEHFRTPVT